MLSSEETLPFCIAAFIFFFVLALGVGANDVANVIAISVGAKAITLRKAYIFATVGEIIGVLLTGIKDGNLLVEENDLVNISLYKNDTQTLQMAGNVAALSGMSIWVAISSILGLPVSILYSMYGALIGYHLVTYGNSIIHWKSIGNIIWQQIGLSFFSCAFAIPLFHFLRKFVSRKSNLESMMCLISPSCALMALAFILTVLHSGISVIQIPLRWEISSSLLLSLGVFFLIFFCCKSCCQKILDPLPAVDQQYSLTTDISSSKPTDHELQQLAVCFGKGWKVLMERLGVSKAFMDVVEYECQQKDMREQVYKCLCQWKKLKPNTATIGCLLSNIEQLHGELNLDMDRFDTIRTSIECRVVDVHTPLTDKVDDTRIDMQTKEIPSIPSTAFSSATTIQDLDTGRNRITEEDQGAAKLFEVLQIIYVLLSSYLHGSHVIMAAFGPMLSIWKSAASGRNEFPQMDSLTSIIVFEIIVGIFVSCGLWICGRKVISTVGDRLSRTTPSSGFSVESGVAVTCLLASFCSVPISVTYWKVGCIVAMGRFRSKNNVDFPLFGKIVLSWFFGVPMTGFISAMVMAVLQKAFF